MATTAIEAKSLSSLTSLAANPPVRPQNVYIDPLVLYIARVPGSRDVFLSPMKPRQKVVTAEDVASSLYYLHVNSSEDESLLESTDEDDGIDAPEVVEAPPQLPTRPAPTLPQHGLPDALRPGAGNSSRHPLPDLPPYPLDDGPPPVPPHAHVERKSVMSVPRKPAPGMPQRKPVGSQLTEVVDIPPLLPRRKPIESSSEGVAPQRPYLAQRPTMSTAASDSEHTPEVTVIRRNPASGEQWNIGTISDPPVFDIASNGRRGSMTSSRIRKSGQPLYLSISNPGYTKFIPSNERSAVPSAASSTPSLAYSDTPTDDSTTEPLFTRRMWLEGSLFEKATNSSHRKSLSADQAAEPNLLSPSPRPTFSSHSTETLPPTDDLRRLSLATDSSRRSNTRGYTFLSPWDGRCEFASGTMGNSLKCRHLRMKNSLNPSGNVPEQISELRFNLPGGGPLASSEPRRRTSPQKDGKESRRSRFMAKFSDRGSSSDYADAGPGGEDMGMDLRLGQELAGGGFAGKQAKLGKLIVEGEGLQMLDLIVSANMALWFRAWEKYQDGGGR